MNIFLVCSIIVAAGDKKAESQPVPQSEIRFWDGTVLRCRILDRELKVVTRYGILSVPIADCDSIEPGASHADLLYKNVIDDLLLQLGSEAAHKRIAAQSAIEQFSPAGVMYRRLEVASKEHKLLEVRKRAESAFGVIGSDLTLEARDQRSDDLLQAATRVLVTIQQGTLKCATPHFGEQNIRLADVQRILVTAVRKHSANVPADGAWHDTGLSVSDARDITMYAEGSVDVWMQEAGKYLVTPRGYSSSAHNSSFPAGGLICRIDNGTPFFVGDQFSFGRVSGSANKSDRPRRIFLSIAPSPWAGGLIGGSYSVRFTSEAR